MHTPILNGVKMTCFMGQILNPRMTYFLGTDVVFLYYY